MTPRRGSEAAEQEALFHWARLAAGRLPELAYMFHVPNARPNRFERMNMGRQGVKRGVPDIMLLVARGGYHGLLIELKIEGGSVSPTQEAFLAFAREQGYQALVCWGWTQAKDAIESYLALHTHDWKIVKNAPDKDGLKFLCVCGQVKEIYTP